MIAHERASRNEAIGTRQFALLWGILFIDVMAGIGILARASPMMQDLFGRTPMETAAIVSIISIFNAGGRVVWSSASDYLVRRTTYAIFFATQLVLFPLVPSLASRGAWIPYQLCLFAIFTMYVEGSPRSPHSAPTSSARALWGRFMVKC